MSPWPWISTLLRASIEGGLLIAGAWLVSRSWRTLPAWARSVMWWLASARLLVALAPWSSIAMANPVPRVAAWWPAGIASPPAPRTTAAVLPPPSVAPPASALAPSPTASAAARAPAPRRATFRPRLDARALGFGLVLLWGAGVLLRLAGLARQFARVRRIRRTAAPAAARVPASLVASPGVRVALHEEVPAPMVTGLWRPWVLLPAAMAQQSAEGLRLAVAHELSHVRRGDLWLAWIPALAEALFWFHPLVPLCTREYVQACEEACDEDALRATGAHPYEYGRLLLTLGVDRRWMGAGAMPFGSPNPRQLVRRLSMLEHVSPLKPHVRTAAVSLVCAFALVGLAPIRVVPAAGASRLPQAPSPAASGGAANALEQALPPAAPMAAPARGAAIPGRPPVSASLIPLATPSGAPSGIAERDPLPPDDPEVTPSPDDGEDPDPGADLDEDEPVDPDADEDVAPIPPVPPSAAVAPRTPRAPRDRVSPLPAPAPRARVSERGSHYSYSYSDSDDPADRFAYVLVHGDDEAMNGSGNMTDWDEVRRIRGRLEGDFLWVRDGNRRYVIDDPEVLRQVEEAFAPQHELGQRQSRLGAAQSRIGAQQSKIGEAQSRIGVAQSEIGLRQADLARRMARRQARGDDLRELDRMSSELSDQMEMLGRQQEKLASQMEPLSRQQGVLGSQMEELSRQMARVSRTATRRVRGLIDRAIQDGDARPLH